MKRAGQAVSPELEFNCDAQTLYRRRKTTVGRGSGRKKLSIESVQQVTESTGNHGDAVRLSNSARGRYELNGKSGQHLRYNKCETMGGKDPPRSVLNKWRQGGKTIGVFHKVREHRGGSRYAVVGMPSRRRRRHD